jgi:hypothetical protein
MPCRTRDWPLGSRLSGFKYERFAPIDAAHEQITWDVDQRIAWLRRLSPHDPLPWHQAARAYAARGATGEAERILISQRRVAVGRAPAADWRPLRRLGRVANWAYGLLGYGFRPWRALLPIVVLLVAVAISLAPRPWHASMRTIDETGQTYSPAGAEAATSVTAAARPGLGQCGDGRVRCFNPYFYAIDTVVPLIDLGQRSTWHPSRDAGGVFLEIWLDICAILGWLFSSILVLSFARLARSSLYAAGVFRRVAVGCLLVFRENVAVRQGLCCRVER